MAEENPAVTKFREYIKIKSVHPDIDYNECVNFLTSYAKEHGLDVHTVTIVAKKPIVVMTYHGTQPELPSILLNSHMDVVPVYPDKWDHDPFGAVKDNEGVIYGRGTQDMKSVGIQYVEAIGRLIKQGIKLKRTIHISFVPDEEIGGKDGMKAWVNSEDFKKLNVGCGFDEGTAYVTEEYLLYYTERAVWHVNIHCQGTTGHGSAILDNTAGEKLRKVLDAFMDFKDKENSRLEADDNMILSDITNINLTILHGGVSNNVVPEEVVVGFDIRLAVDLDHDEFEAWIEKVCKEAGSQVWAEYTQKDPKADVTNLDDSNKFWMALKDCCNRIGVKLNPVVCPGGTDARYLRQAGIPAFGVTFLNNTAPLLHGNNEYVHESVFLKGIDIYFDVIQAVANC